MTRFRIPLLLAVAATGGALAASALAGTTVVFSASYAGKATAKVAGQKVTIAALGAGKGTLVGPSKIAGRGTGDASNPPCVPFSGPGTITGAGGVKLKLVVLPISRGCAAEDDQNQVTVSGRAKVAGGTGKFAKARGTLRFTGHFDRGTGAFTVKLTGALLL